MAKTNKIRVPYALSVHGKGEIDAVTKVLKGNTVLGKQTIEFEKKIASLFGKKYGVMVNSGSSANLIAVELMNLPKGSEVITPLLTFATTVSPLVQKGLVPVFIDVEPNTYLINISSIERAITRKTKAIFIPSLIGNIPALDKLRKIARKHNLWFVEDSCDTLGAKYKGRPTGVYSDLSTTSFYGSHIINGAGGGGMILMDDKELYKRAVVLRGWGRNSSLMGESYQSEDINKRFKVKINGIPYDEKFVFGEIGYNFLPLEVSSAFGLKQLKRLSNFSATRNRHFKSLRNFFAGYNEFVHLPVTIPNVKTNWLAFPVHLKKSAHFTRGEICKYLEQNNIQTRTVFTGNILHQPAFRKIRAKKADIYYTNTENVMKNAFLIGCHQGLSEKQVEHMKEAFRQFFEQYV